MEEGKRQKQVAGVIMEEMSQIFQKMGLSMMGTGMVSISSVKITPDLLEARIYLSLFQVGDAKAAMKKIEEASPEIKRQLAAKVKHQLRRIPVIRYFQDDTLDHVFRLEEIFKKIESEKRPNEEN